MKLESLFFLSERRDSNPRPSAWKANALSTELLSQINFQLLNSQFPIGNLKLHF